jgi:hypothetical protein
VVRDLLAQIRTAIDHNLYFLALFGALAIPDICGALGSANGEASKKKYTEWFDQNVASKYGGLLNGEDCYYYRCSCLHQGSSQHPQSTFSRIIFIEPGTSRMIAHCNIINDVLNIDLKIFCEDLITSAEVWLTANEGTPLYMTNAAKFIQRQTGGLISNTTFIG